MKPIENTFEEQFILELAPIAQRVAFAVFSTWSLPQMMDHWLNAKRPDQLLRDYDCPPRFWRDILRAAMIAKVTYFLPNPRFKRQQVEYLLALASALIDRPMTEFPPEDALAATQRDYPVLHRWLQQFQRLRFRVPD